MAYEIGSATNSGAGGLAHYDLLDKIMTFVTTNAALVAAGQNWTVLRYDTVSANRELILQGPGLSGTEQIFVGFKTYQDANADYYNIAVATFIGYTAGNTFETQPGASSLCGVPAHNLNIDYFLTANGQRINFALKIGTPVYQSGQVGKFFPYASPNQYPQPLIAAGMLSGTPATRYSDTAYSMPWKGNRAGFRMRFNDGVWKTPAVHPYKGLTTTDLYVKLRTTGSNWHLTPLTLYDSTPNIYGELDGWYHIVGFNNVVENVIQLGGTSVVDPTGKTVAQICTDIETVGGTPYLVVQDVWRTGFGDLVALEMK